MSEIKYLLDEHVNPRLRKALKRSAPDIVVWRLGDPGAPPLSTLDPEILLWCEDHGFSLVTNNRESMPVHLREHLAAGRRAPGIFTLNPNMTLGETAVELSVKGRAEVSAAIKLGQLCQDKFAIRKKILLNPARMQNAFAMPRGC